jgi:cyclase
MDLRRVIPCLLFDGAALVKTTRFVNPKYIGDPINAIRIFNEKEVDELVVLDITASRENRPPRFDFLEVCASECFMPFSYGGGVSRIEHFARLYKSGIEKVIVNTLALRQPLVVEQAVKEYGSSSVVGAVDYKRSIFRRKIVYSASGARPRRNVLEHCRFLADDLGVGEILLTCVDREGTWEGYDVETVDLISRSVSVPLIASGGAGSIHHIRELFNNTAATAAAIGSMAVYQKKGMGVLISFPDRRVIFSDQDAYGTST